MKRTGRCLIAALLCVTLLIGFGSAAFAVSPTAAARLYDLEAEVGFEIIPLNADGEVITPAPGDPDRDGENESVYSDVEQLSLSFAGTVGQEYIVYLLYGEKTPSETSIRYIFQESCTNGTVNFTIMPSQMAEIGTYYLYVAGDIYTLAGSFTVAGPKTEDEDRVVAAVTYTDANGDPQTADAVSLEKAMSVAMSLIGSGVKEVEVQLQADCEVGELLIYPGVTLNLNSYALTADYIVGLNGGALTATPNSGKLIVAKGNLFLPEEGYKNASGQYVLPIWDPEQNCYLFSLFVVNTNNANRGLFIDEGNETIRFQFKHQATGDINKGLLDDGSSDNALKVIVRLVWESENGESYQDFVYNDGFVKKVAVGENSVSYDYSFTLTGYSAMNIKLDTLKVVGMIITDSGAVASGTVWTAEMAK